MYKYLLNEQKPGTCGIFTGRFQPLHNGHFSIIKAMAQENTLNFVFVVAGAKSSSDKDKNPLSGPERVKLIDSIAPSNVGVLEAKSAYIPDLIKEIESRVMGTKCFQIYAGDDRADSYTRFILKIKEMGYDAIVNTKDYNRAGVSASKVRELMREGNFKEAQKFLPYSVDKIKRFF
jgi:cytidyltransferase-like protein